MYLAVLDLSVFVLRHWDNPVVLFVAGCMCVCLSFSLVRRLR